MYMFYIGNLYLNLCVYTDLLFLHSIWCILSLVPSMVWCPRTLNPVLLGKKSKFVQRSPQVWRHLSSEKSPSSCLAYIGSFGGLYYSLLYTGIVVALYGIPYSYWDGRLCSLLFRFFRSSLKMLSMKSSKHILTKIHENHETILTDT